MPLQKRKLRRGRFTSLVKTVALLRVSKRKISLHFVLSWRLWLDFVMPFWQVSGHVVLCKHIIIAVDNMAAIGIADGRYHADLALLGYQLTSKVRAIRLKVQCDFTWVPSHGKIVSGWKPHALAGECALRTWNSKADQLAAAKRHALHQNSQRKTWFEQWRRARDWEFKALSAASAADKLYRQFLEL